KGGLVPGDAAKVEVARWAFDRYGNHGWSLRDLAGDLNKRHVPPPRGKMWYARTLGVMLRQPAYRGTFRFNLNHRGQVFGIDAEGEVVESAELGQAGGKLFVAEAVYEPLIEPGLFDRVQARLKAEAADRGRCNRSGDYALTGILRCGHCGTPMYGVRVH